MRNSVPFHSGRIPASCHSLLNAIATLAAERSPIWAQGRRSPFPSFPIMNQVKGAVSEAESLPLSPILF